MTKYARRLARLHDFATDLGFVAGACAITAMAAIYCYEMIVRYHFGAATKWGNETIAHLQLVVVFTLLPHVTRIGTHISVDLVHQLRARWSPIIRLYVNIVGCGACTFMAWASYGENLRQFERFIETQGNFPIPKWWVSVWITYGFASAALYFLRAAVTGRRAKPVLGFIPGGTGQL